MKIITKQILKEAIWIFIIASILGFTINKFHPRSVKISSKRPPLEYAADTLFAQDLPLANIQIDQENVAEKQNIIEGPLIVNTKQVLQLIANRKALLLDARSKEEYLKGHIPNAQNLPFENLSEYEEQLTTMPKDKWLVCYCDGPHCDMGELLAYELINLGYELVASYNDGMNAWKKSGNVLQEKQNDKNAN